MLPKVVFLKGGSYLRSIPAVLAVANYNKLSITSLEMCLLRSKLRCNRLSHFMMLERFCPVLTLAPGRC